MNFLRSSDRTRTSPSAGTRAAPLVLLASAALLWCNVAGAAPKDAQAKKALTDAMEVDYLNTDFDKAEDKLKKAIDVCGAKGCTPVLKSKLYVALGSVQAGGKRQLDDAKESFIEALKLDKAAALDPDVASTEITFAFDRAKAELKMAPAPAKPAGTDGLVHLPPAEQKVATPVPLYAELEASLVGKAKKVTVSYLGPGSKDWRSLIMKKLGEKSYGINVPCGELGSEGTLKYAVTVTGDEDEVLATAGSRTDPLTVPIKKSIDGEPPHWPDTAPPETCGNVEAGPKQCIDDSQCSGGLSCVGGECKSKIADTPAGDDKGIRKNWFSLAFVADVSIVSGDQVCTKDSQDNNNFACFREDGSRYTGTPTIVGQDIGNNVNGGPALSTMRIMVGYDRLLLDNLTVGVRLGFAFNGAPEGADFLPIHAEARAAYWLGKSPFASTGARPYLMLGGGVMQVDTRVDVQVLENGEACGAEEPNNRTSRCTEPSPGSNRVEERIQALDAYKQAGFGFVGAGVGLMYSPMPLLGLNIAVRGSITLPVVTPVISPEAGVALGF